MTLQSLALLLAGVIGLAVALVHGVLIDRLMVGPFQRISAADGSGLSGVAARLTAPMLQFSAFAWGLGGLALVAAAIWLDVPARRPLALFVAALFAYGAVANFWVTDGRHFGWMLMAVAIALIAASILAGG